MCMSSRVSVCVVPPAGRRAAAGHGLPGGPRKPQNMPGKVPSCMFASAGPGTTCVSAVEHSPAPCTVEGQGLRVFPGRLACGRPRPAIMRQVVGQVISQVVGRGVALLRPRGWSSAMLLARSLARSPGGASAVRPNHDNSQGHAAHWEVPTELDHDIHSLAGHAATAAATASSSTRRFGECSRPGHTTSSPAGVSSQHKVLPGRGPGHPTLPGARRRRRIIHQSPGSAAAWSEENRPQPRLAARQQMSTRSAGGGPGVTCCRGTGLPGNPRHTFQSRGALRRSTCQPTLRHSVLWVLLPRGVGRFPRFTRRPVTSGSPAGPLVSCCSSPAGPVCPVSLGPGRFPRVTCRSPAGLTCRSPAGLLPGAPVLLGSSGSRCSPAGLQLVTCWSPAGHLLVTCWSPAGDLLVTCWFAGPWCPVC